MSPLVLIVCTSLFAVFTSTDSLLYREEFRSEDAINVSLSLLGTELVG